MNEALYNETIRELANDPLVRSMENYSQHGSSNTFKHCMHVAEVSGKISKFLRLKVNTKDLARGAMLHDFFLYDIHNGDVKAFDHGMYHAEIALENANERYDLSDIEKNIIYSHMWPLNITHLPKYKESVIVGIADKYSAIYERAGAIKRMILAYV
ncbi:uncharacterized protein SAMN02910289_00560 [Lachnospiraceae bacterium RM5]|nr:uncharacterized protein SAMN02910289_00560 [Lachnospiraceae bacterium RM5]